MHLIKLLCYPYTLHFQFYVNLCQNFYNHVNSKLLQSCQFQTSIVMSISNSCSHAKSISIYIHNAVCYMFGQVASSHPRTACACQFILVIGRVASSHPRTACACQFILVIGQVTSSGPRTACTRAFLFLLSAKRLVRVQEQLVPVNLLLLSAKRLVQIQEQLVPIYLSVFSVKFPVRAKRTTCTYQFAVCFPSEPYYWLSWSSFFPIFGTFQFTAFYSTIFYCVSTAYFTVPVPNLLACKTILSVFLALQVIEEFLKNIAYFPAFYSKFLHKIIQKGILVISCSGTHFSPYICV